jgi:hypothetical protein
MGNGDDKGSVTDSVLVEAYSIVFSPSFTDFRSCESAAEDLAPRNSSIARYKTAPFEFALENLIAASRSNGVDLFFDLY